MLEHLLQPLSDASPSGENLEYDPVFSALMLAAQPVAERQAMGSTKRGETPDSVAGAEPDHSDVIEKAMDVLGRSHDLRAAVVLAASRLRVDGLPGLAEVTGYIRGLLEQYWDSCHPELDADDDDDPTMRINAVLGMGDGDGLLRYMRLTPLSESPTFGRFSLRDIAIAEGESPAPEGMDRVPDLNTIAAAFKDTKPDLLRARYEAMLAIAADVKAIDAVFDERTPGQGPDLSGLQRLARKGVTRMASALGEDAVAAAATAGDDAAAGDVPTAGAVAAGPAMPQGPITSPADVRRALDAIITYYRQYEPSSPLPLLIHRAHRLVGADFMAIVKDLAPDSFDDLRKLGGIEDEDDD